MQTISIFCEDLRDEVAGSLSLIGVMPDNVEVASADGALPKLIVYTRINLSVDEEIEEITCFLRTSNGEDVAHSIFPVEQIKEAFDQAKSQGNVIAGLVSRIQASPFPARPGRVLSITRYRGDEYISGTLNFLLAGHSASKV